MFPVAEATLTEDEQHFVFFDGRNFHVHPRTTSSVPANLRDSGAMAANGDGLRARAQGLQRSVITELALRYQLEIRDDRRCKDVFGLKARMPEL